MLGSTSVGKTSLINRITENKFDPNTPPTTGAGFFHYKTGTREIQIWDTGGMERFRALNSVYYRGAVGAILVFDLTNNDSFQELESWRNEFISNTNSNPVILLVGNKCDQTSDIEVEDSDIKQYTDEHGLPFFKTSALTGENVGSVLEALLKLIPEKVDNVTSVDLDQGKSSCC